MNNKFFVTSFNEKKNGNISDGWSYHNLIEYGGLKHLSVKTDNFDEAKFVVYIRNYEGGDFKFDENLAKKNYR